MKKRKGNLPKRTPKTHLFHKRFNTNPKLKKVSDLFSHRSQCDKFPSIFSSSSSPPNLKVLMVAIPRSIVSGVRVRSCETSRGAIPGPQLKKKLCFWWRVGGWVMGSKCETVRRFYLMDFGYSNSLQRRRKLEKYFEARRFWLARRGRRDREAMISNNLNTYPWAWFIFFYKYLHWYNYSSLGHWQDNHNSHISCTPPPPQHRQKTKHARHPTYQVIPVQRPVHTQSPALSHPPQWPRKCLAEILESYSRCRYALIFYIYVQYTNPRDDQEGT